MLAIGLDHLLADTEKPRRMDRQAAFLFGLPASGILGTLHMVDLAADDAPVAGLRCLQAPAEKDLAFPQDCKPAAETRKIDAREGHGA